MNWDWTGFFNWTNGAFGLGGTVVAFLIGGKVWRVNRIDKASTDAQVAGINAETAAADSVSASLERLQKTVGEQSTKIENLSHEVSQLRDEIHGLNNRRSVALDLLEEIKLCGACEEKFGVMLRTAIRTLREHEHDN